MIGDECPIEEALMVGLPPIVKDWLLHNQSEQAKTWRRKFQEYAAWKFEAANWRQAQIQKELRANPPENTGQVRFKACIDPVLFHDMRRRYGSECWRDPDFVKDTEKKSPELFVPKK